MRLLLYGLTTCDLTFWGILLRAVTETRCVFYSEYFLFVRIRMHTLDCANMRTVNVK